MKLFIHEILPANVTRTIFIDTDAFFISDPRLLWEQFATFDEQTAIAMPSHPELSAPQWHDASKICSCVMLLDLARLRALRLMDSSVYRAEHAHALDNGRENTHDVHNGDTGVEALSPPAFLALFGPPDAHTGKYRDVALGDQSYWWAIISHRPEIYKHLAYDWEVSSCLVDMYMTGLGDPDESVETQLRVQKDRVNKTPHEGQVIIPRLLHLCVSSL